jgi:alcohol dehydrogenase
MADLPGRDEQSATAIATFQASTHLCFGPGCAASIGQTALSLSIHSALVVSDPGVRAAGITDRIGAMLTKSGVGNVIFDEVEPNPSLETSECGIAMYRNSGCAGLVAVGGGSSIDSAKAIGILATNPGTLLDYVGADKVINPLPPLLVLPTTVGSGSEVTRFAVITDRTQRKKQVITSSFVSPNYAFLDPDVVDLLPSHLIASTGMDTLTHAIESVISNYASPFSDALALEAIRLVRMYLALASRSTDKTARARMLYASTMAGMAFNNARTGLVHGMSHPLSSYYGVPHGLANAILLPYVLEFDLPACVAAMTRVAAAMGQMAKPEAAIDAVRDLRTDLGIPSTLSDVGVTEVWLPNMTQDAFESGNARLVNPRAPSYHEIEALYLRAL